MGADERTPAFRRLSLIELVAGSFIVIGHDLLHIVPNEVPRRNLWACVLTHGFIDTVAIVRMYSG